MTIQRQTGRLHIKATIPPGRSLVGVIPHTMFRLERVRLMPSPDVALLTANGQSRPFDGRIHDLASSWGERTLTIGSLLAFSLDNRANEPRDIEMKVGGTCIEWPMKDGDKFAKVTHGLVLGLFPQEASFVSPPDDEDDGLNLDPSTVDDLVELNAVALLERNPLMREAIAKHLSISTAELLERVQTPEGRDAIAEAIMSIPDLFISNPPPSADAALLLDAREG